MKTAIHALTSIQTNHLTMNMIIITGTNNNIWDKRHILELVHLHASKMLGEIVTGTRRAAELQIIIYEIADDEVITCCIIADAFQIWC